MGLHIEGAAGPSTHDTDLAVRIAEYAIRTTAYADQFDALLTMPPSNPVPFSTVAVHFPTIVEDREPGTDPLPDTQNADPIALDDDGDATIEPAEYGDRMQVARSLVAGKGYAYTQSTGEHMFRRELRRRNLLIKAIADANANVVFANNAADADALGDNDVLTVANLRRIRVILSSENHVPKFLDMNGLRVYHAVTPAACIADLFQNKDNLAGFTDLAKYIRPDLAYSGEVGLLEGFRLVSHDEDLVEALGAAEGASDLCTTHICGMNYIGGVINNPLSIMWEPVPGDPESRFWQFRTYGCYGFGLLREDNGLRFLSRSYNTATP